VSGSFNRKRNNVSLLLLNNWFLCYPQKAVSIFFRLESSPNSRERSPNDSESSPNDWECSPECYYPQADSSESSPNDWEYTPNDSESSPNDLESSPECCYPQADSLERSPNRSGLAKKRT